MRFTLHVAARARVSPSAEFPHRSTRVWREGLPPNSTAHLLVHSLFVGGLLKGRRTGAGSQWRGSRLVCERCSPRRGIAAAIARGYTSTIETADSADCGGEFLTSLPSALPPSVPESALRLWARCEGMCAARVRTPLSPPSLPTRVVAPSSVVAAFVDFTICHCTDRVYSCQASRPGHRAAAAHGRRRTRQGAHSRLGVVGRLPRVGPRRRALNGLQQCVNSRAESAS